MRRRLSSSAPAVPFSLRVFLSSPAFFSFSPSLFLLLSRARARIRVSLSVSVTSPSLSCDPSRSSAVHAGESDTHESSFGAHTHNTHLPFLPADRSAERAGRPAPFASLSPSLPDRVSSSYRRAFATSPLHPHPRARYAPAAVHSAGNLRSASFVSRVAPSVCVTGSALLLSRRSSLLPPPRRPHAHIERFSLGRTLSLSPSSLAVPSFFPLFLLLSVVRRRGRRLPDRLALIPSARRRLLFFASLSLHPPAPGIGGGCGGCGGCLSLVS